MARVRRGSVVRVGLILALLCPFAWLYTGWHLAVESHRDHDRPSAIDHDHDHGHHDHDRGPPAEAPLDEGHPIDDHLIPDSLRPEQGPELSVDLDADVVLEELAITATPTATPCDDVPPATDPPIESRRPRAPPVG